MHIHVGAGFSIKENISSVPHSLIVSCLNSLQIEEIKAALSNREYQIITECAQANFSETPNLAPSLIDSRISSTEADALVPQVSDVEYATQDGESWIMTKVSVAIDLVVLCLRTGIGGDTSLATVGVRDGFLSASLDGFTVTDDRVGTEEGLRLAIGKPEDIRNSPINAAIDYKNWSRDYVDATNDDDVKIVPTMLILDAKFSQSSSFMSLCVQRPQLLVALDFLLAVVEFFIPSIGDVLSHEDGEKSLALNIVDAVTLDQSVYRQPSAEMALSPQRPLIVDNERYNHFIYDGQGGTLYLKDGWGKNLSAPSKETMIYVANGKKLQFKNVIIKDGRYLDSCVLLGTNSSYTALKDDHVCLEEINEASCGPYLKGDVNQELPPNNAVVRSTEFTIELQAIGPELTFYSASKEVAESQSLILSKLLHAQLDVLCRLVMKNETIEMSANALGLTMESNGIRILEPFDTTLNYSNASGKTNIQLSVSDIFMNFSFSILKLFLAVEEDILAFLRMTSRKITVVCSQFDKVGTIRNPQNGQVYMFWRPRAPPGFALLGDYLTPTEKPPTKGVIAVNTNFARVKNPLSFRLVWPTLSAGISSEQWSNGNEGSLRSIVDERDTSCHVWFPEAPKGYVALGCVVSQGRKEPPLSSVSCILTSLVTPCPLRDCITIRSDNLCSSTLAFWRVCNSAGTFLPADPITGLLNVAYELRHLMFPIIDSPRAYKSPNTQASSGHIDAPQPQRSIGAGSCRRFEVITDFELVWLNQGSSSGRGLSIWRPVVPQGMVYFGDIAVQGYELPSTCTVLYDTGGEELFSTPLDFLAVGQIKKQRGVESISFWMPQAPPGYVSLGCVACKSMPKQYDISALRCIRSDMVSGAQFSEESLWDTSGTKTNTEPFSIWAVGNDSGTFIVRSGFKKPPQRFALKLADSTNSLDDTVINAEISTFSAAIFDDYGGLMVPLFNVSLSGLGFTLHGRGECINSTASFSLNVRSYNDKYEAWEPLVEPVDGLLRYQYDLNAPGAASQLRIASRRDLNLNVSVSNANMIIQAYASWSNLSHAHKSDKEQKEEAGSSTSGGGSIIGVHHKRDYFIIPRNKLGQDIFIRATEIRGLPNIIRMPSGDMKPLKVPVLKNMLDSHMKGKLGGNVRAMVTVLIADAQILRVEGSTSKQYTVTIRLIQDQSISSESLLKQQSARTRGIGSEHSSSSDQELVNWGEMFFFKVDSPDIYKVELTVIDTGNGNPVGFSSSPLKQVAEKIPDSLSPSAYLNKLSWMDLFSAQSVNSVEETKGQKLCGRIRCGILLSPGYEVETRENSCMSGKKSGYIQISPSREGPWTTVRLNYAAPAACWRLGNDVIASEVTVKDGDRYVDIRSLVTVRNNTDITLDLCLKSKALDDRTLDDASRIEVQQFEDDKTEKHEFFETEEYKPSSGWVSSSFPQENLMSESPPGWNWIDDWHLGKMSVTTADGWVYAPDVESLKWPESCDSLKSVNYARQRKWVRTRKKVSGHQKLEISLGQLSPGDAVPLPLSGLIQSEYYVLQLRPSRIHDSDEYSWSSVVNKIEDSGEPKGISEIRVSALAESDELLYCTPLNGTSSNGSQKLWFCVSIQATELAKDIHLDPIQDWNIVIKAPLSLTNFLPLAVEFTVLEMQAGDQSAACARGMLCPAAPVNVYNADIRNQLFLSLLPQRGWLPVHEAILLSHPRGVPAKTMSLKSATSGRIAQIILEQNYEREQPMLSKVIRVYAPYWFEISRCPPLTLRFIDMGGKKSTRKFALPFHSKKSNEKVFEEIAEGEIYDGHTIASALNFNMLGLSVSSSGEGHFGPVKDLSLLGDMDGSLDIDAYDADGKCVKLFVSTKPCPYQSIPTKVICIRPFITFTNRLGQDILLKLSCRDDTKVLRACDFRVSFPYHDDNGPNKLQVRLGDTEWSYPIQITKEDTISLVLRTQAGIRKFVKTEIRGYEEGSRFIVVFRLGSAFGPIRMENRTGDKKISIRQAGFDENYWIQMEPFSTTNFSWEDPYGQKFIEAKVDEGSSGIWKFDLEESGLHLVEQGELKMKFHVFEMVDVKVGRFIDDKTSNLDENMLVTSTGNQGSTQLPAKKQNEVTPLELIVELGALGVSLIDHRPKELSYMYLERVFISYSTSYDGGTATRFKLILGCLQIDNQLPLTLMPVLLAPEQATDLHHPVFKMTVTVCNENPDGIVVYPRVQIRVTDKWWRLNIHEPIIWALVDLYSNIQMDRLPQTSSVTQVDPEIQVNSIDISEVRLKVSLETAPAQRPHGVLGVWSPVLSAIGNAFKIQLHLRRVMRKDRFMRKSSILPAIGNRIMRDLIHNPLHLLFSVDVLGMASSTLASLSRGFAELSSDGQFLQLRSKQVRSRRITGVGDGILRGTEALAQGFAFGVSGVVTKPVESAKQSGPLGLAHGVGRAFLGIVVQPLSGALDFFSMTVDGVGASCAKCLEVLNSKTSFHRIRNPRAIRTDGILRDYCEREALGQMILYLAEASRRFGCTEIFKEPSKFAWSDYYEEHFVVPYQRIVLVTSKRVMLLQCLDLNNMDKRPCKIMWDVSWQELMALELAKAGCNQPSHLILHLKSFRRSENFVRVIKCITEVETEGTVPQAVTVCSVVRKMWKAYQSDMKCHVLKVPSSQRHVYFAWSEADGRETLNLNKAIVRSREFSSSNSVPDDRKFVKHSINFTKIWSSERETKGRCNLCRKQSSDHSGICSIWRPICPNGYVSVGDIARVGEHPPNCAAVYSNSDRLFALPIGYDLVWRNCLDDYTTPISIWHPRAPEGFVSLGCVAIPNFTEPQPDLVYCVAESLAEQTEFEEQKIWTEPESYPWACHIYQIKSDALHFMALRQTKEDSDWKPVRVHDEPAVQLHS
ncbi:hypothetical protein EUGRSUZ_D02142 [Eucalyptus grandis]|nr:hypothetical protein EUGRSUZ_D02142 [Eucalyptus grandis]